MITIKKEGIVLDKRKLGFEVKGVLNPAVIKEAGAIHIFYRAVAKGNHSTIGYCRMKSPLEAEDRWDMPMVYPEHPYEEHGVEDPRIVKIDDTFYISYCAFDGVNALGALLSSTDMKHWKKEGVIVAQIGFAEFKRLAETKGGRLNERYVRYNHHEGVTQFEGKKVFVWDKNVVFFPRKINGKFYFMHRIKPDIQLTAVNDLSELTPAFWHYYFINLKDNIMLAPKYDHEMSFVGGGCPPIETEAGWVVIYHGVRDAVSGYVYSACAALFDLENPEKELARLPYPLFGPETEWEHKGEVSNVCFPTGAVLEDDDTLYIYYGAADSRVACASLQLSELVNELKQHTITNEN